MQILTKDRAQTMMQWWGSKTFRMGALRHTSKGKHKGRGMNASNATGRR